MAFDTRADQSMPRIRNPWKTGVGEERDLCARFQTGDQFRGATRFVVLMITDEWLGDAEMLQEQPRMPRVFGRNQVNGAKRLQRAHRDICAIADRRRNHEEHTLRNDRLRKSGGFQSIAMAAITS